VNVARVVTAEHHCVLCVHYLRRLVGCVVGSQLHAARNLLRLTGPAGVDLVGKVGTTPLGMACRNGFVEMSALFIDNGADVNKETQKGSTPLIEAAKNNHIDLVEMLVSREADVARRNKLGLNAADWALRSGHKCVRCALSFLPPLPSSPCPML
jgi:ankyrin repeat protein